MAELFEMPGRSLRTRRTPPQQDGESSPKSCPCDSDTHAAESPERPLSWRMAEAISLKRRLGFGIAPLSAGEGGSPASVLLGPAGLAEFGQVDFGGALAVEMDSARPRNPALGPGACSARQGPR